MIERVRKALENDLNNINVRIDNIEFVKEGNNKFLRIFIDSDEVVNIDKCVEVTKIINPILDQNNIIDEAYILDVTSKEKGE